MRYGWIIDRDMLADAGTPEGTNANAKGVVGPRDITPEIEQRLNAGLGHVFLMKDDDGDLYYEGRWLGADMEPGDALPEEAFGPLNDFGGPNAGATEILYWGDGAWEVL